MQPFSRSRSVLGRHEPVKPFVAAGARAVNFLCEDELSRGSGGLSCVESLYGPSVLSLKVEGQGSSCAMHFGHYAAKCLTEVGCNVESVVVGDVTPCFGGLRGCTAGEGEKVLDRRLAEIALRGTFQGFAYRHSEGLSVMKRFEKGALLPLASCHGPYAYLRMFRDGAMRRVARILGPYPMDSDILAMYRCVGRAVVDAGVVSVEEMSGVCVVRELLSRVRAVPYSFSRYGLEGEFGAGYCYAAVVPQVVKDVSALGPDPEWISVQSELLRGRANAVAVDGVRLGVDRRGRPMVHLEMGRQFSSLRGFCDMMNWLDSRLRGLRVGGSLTSVVVDEHEVSVKSRGFRGERETGSGGADVEYGMCDICNCRVKLQGHAERCRVVERKSKEEVAADKRLVLLGDALHRFDVVQMIVGCEGFEQYSKEVERYVSSVAQKAYLRSVGIELPNGRSIHSWGSEFERRCVVEEFRRGYLAWLIRDYTGGGESVAAVSRLASSVDFGWSTYPEVGGTELYEG